MKLLKTSLTKINKIFGFVKKLVKPGLVLVLIGLIITIVMLTIIRYYATYSKPEHSDVIIVEGCKVDGKMPSLTLLYRLEETLKLFKEGKAKYIIVSGGQGEDEIYPEAEVMKNWLVQRDVGKNVIFEESKSQSTYQNLKYSKQIMDKNGFETAIIVTSDYHMFRSLLIAGRLGINATGSPACSVSYLWFNYYSREVLASLKSIVFDW